MPASLVLLHRVKVGFATIALFAVVIALSSHLLNAQVEDAFEEYSDTTRQLNFVDTAIGYLERAQSAALQYHTSATDGRAAATYYGLDRLSAHMDTAPKELGDRASVASAIGEDIANYRAGFTSVVDQQKHIDQINVKVAENAENIRKGLNSIRFLAIVGGGDLSAEIARAKDAFFDASGMLVFLMRDGQQSAYERAISQLHAARSVIDTIAVGAEGDLEARSLELIGDIERHQALLQEIRGAVLTNASTWNVLDYVAPLLRARYEDLREDIIERQNTISVSGASAIDQSQIVVKMLALALILVACGFIWKVGGGRSRSVASA